MESITDSFKYPFSPLTPRRQNTEQHDGASVSRAEHPRSQLTGDRVGTSNDFQADTRPERYNSNWDPKLTSYLQIIDCNTGHTIEHQEVLDHASEGKYEGKRAFATTALDLPPFTYVGRRNEPVGNVPRLMEVVQEKQVSGNGNVIAILHSSEDKLVQKRELNGALTSLLYAIKNAQKAESIPANLRITAVHHGDIHKRGNRSGANKTSFSTSILSLISKHEGGTISAPDFTENPRLRANNAND